MADMLSWLLRLNDLRPDQAGVDVGFAVPLPAWGWALAVVAALAVGWWLYRKLDGPVWARTGLAVCRAALIVLLLVLACGPRLQRPNETLERDRVMMLVDRSSSLRVRDVDAGPERRISRDEQIGSLMRDHAAKLNAFTRERGVDWLGFDAGVFELSPGATPETEGPVALSAANGLRSDLNGAIEQAVERAGARPLAGIVLFSDGQATDEPARAALRRLAAQKIPVLVVPLGSEKPLVDLAVRSVQGPGVAFPGDVVPIEAEVVRSGPGDRAPTGSRVQLIDTVTGRVLQEQAIDWTAAAPDAGRRRLTFTAAPAEGVAGAGGADGAGVQQWAVRLAPESPDLVPENDQLPTRIEVVQRPLRVVYFDGYPRWEYRFLQAVLTRERLMASSALLLAPGRRSIQEGNTPLDHVPLSPAEWDQIDVLVLGDVQPEVFSPEQIRQIRQRVSSGGMGLLWIGGASATPAAWRATPLGDLLPIQSSGGESEGLRLWDRDVVALPTPLADRLGVLRLLREPVDGSWWPAGVSDPSSGWSRLRWAQVIEPGQLKPAAEALALAKPIDNSAPATALVTTMRFGAGRIVYVASDEIWRWRYGRGEDLPQRFWLQLIRLLGRESVGRSGRPLLLSATPARAEVGEPVRVQAELLDQGLIDAAGTALSVRITRVGELTPTGGTTDAATDDRDGAMPAAEVALRSGGGGERRGAGEKPTFTGAWVPGARGLYRAQLVDALLPESARVSVDIEVFTSDDELRRPEADHAALAELAEQTGGRVLAAGDLDRLDELLPRRDLRIALAPDEHALWDTPLALLLLLTLVTVEWVGRRLIRLV